MLRKAVFILFSIFFTGFAVAAQNPQATPPPAQPTEEPPTQQTQNPTQQNPAQPQTPGVTPSGQIANPNTVIQQTPTQSVGTSGIAPAVLPDDPPPVAPDFQAPIRPLPSAERVGVDLMNQLPLTLEEAIERALQNNNNIDVSRNDVQIAEFNLRGAEGIYDPVIASENYFESATTPVASTIGGATNGSVTQRRFFGSAGLSGFSPFAGGLYSAQFNSSRTTTSNTNATLNPQFPSAFVIYLRTADFARSAFRHQPPQYRNRQKKSEPDRRAVSPAGNRSHRGGRTILLESRVCSEKFAGAD